VKVFLAGATGAIGKQLVPRLVAARHEEAACREAGVAMMTEVRGASNAKARTELDWQPLHHSWRHGFAS